MRCYSVYGILTAGKSFTTHYVFVNRNRTCPANMVLKTRYADLPSQQYPIPKQTRKILKHYNYLVPNLTVGNIAVMDFKK